MEILIASLVLAAIGFVLGLLIYIVSKKFYVEEDTRVVDVLNMLPGYNCGACGNAGCSGMAEKIVEGSQKANQCKPIKPDMIEAINKYIEEHKN